jgi:2-keto-myo-inositol isomerase
MNVSRRQVLAGAGALFGASVAGRLEAQTTTARPPAPKPTAPAPRPLAPRTRPADEPFGYCLNTSTIRGNQLDIVGEIAVASKAGYTAIEPWITEIDAYVAKGGTLKDLGKRFADAGLSVENAIAFNSFLTDDEAQRTAAMEKIKIDMGKVAEIGGKRIATPPGNARAAVSLDNAATYYRAALELGAQTGVQPLLELWGTHPVLGPLSHGAYVSVAAGHPDASLLLDVFHLYKSGTAVTSLRQLNGASLHVFHVNDYPQAADSSALNDGNRIYPGDGVASYGQLLRALRDSGFRGVLSLELFNRDYWAKSADENAKAGIDKLRATVKRALG